jgi:hypothetical protein
MAPASRRCSTTPSYMPECERLTELGLFERIEVQFADGNRELAGYRLSRDAALAHDVQTAIEDARGSVN